jgi:4-aminobutyrate aminotransferase-like enzyme
MTARPDPMMLSGGSGSFVTTADGRKLLDLAMGFGSVFLGHAHPAVTASVQRQVAGLWNCSRIATPGQARIDALLSELLPRGMRPAGLYSTGMEAAEFAMRVAATHTGRDGFAGFARSMHGKSAMTASLCWPNAPIRPRTQHLLPFVAEASEPEILDGLVRLLRTQSVAALFIEPIQGSNGAHQASDDFYRKALAACREHGTLCVFDEILTGLYRSGTAFFV